MAKYIGPVVRLNRAEGINLGLKGRRDTDDKYTKRLDKKPFRFRGFRIKSQQQIAVVPVVDVLDMRVAFQQRILCLLHRFRGLSFSFISGPRISSITRPALSATALSL